MAVMRFGAPSGARAVTVKTMLLLTLLLALSFSVASCGYKGDLAHPVAHVQPHTLLAPIA